MTDFLQFSTNRWGYYTGLLPTICYFLQRLNAGQIVDLCSGGSGPWLRLYRTIARASGESFRIVLTDRFPNIAAFRMVCEMSEGVVQYREEPVLCEDIPRDLAGFRTMFGSFHHFPPESARQILQNAVDCGQGIAIFEMTERSRESIAAMLAAPLFVFLHTPLIRPFRWTRLLFTYLLPVIPLVVMIDGIVSCLRTYTMDELRAMIATLEGKPYDWELRKVHSPGSPFPVLYAIGCPSAPPPPEQAISC